MEVPWECLVLSFFITEDTILWSLLLTLVFNLVLIVLPELYYTVFSLHSTLYKKFMS